MLVLKMFLDNNKSLRLCSWNVRGLNDCTKCGDILTELIPQHLAFVALQETKLINPATSKLRSFLLAALLPMRPSMLMVPPAVSSRPGTPPYSPFLPRSLLTTP